MGGRTSIKPDQVPHMTNTAILPPKSTALPQRTVSHKTTSHVSPPSPPTKPKSSKGYVHPPLVYEECRCDKQLSEEILCRVQDLSYLSFTDITQACPTCQTDLAVWRKRNIGNNSSVTDTSNQSAQSTNINATANVNNVDGGNFVTSKESSNVQKTAQPVGKSQTASDIENNHPLPTEFKFAGNLDDMYVKNTNYFIPGTRHHHLSHVQCMDADRPIFFLILGGGHFETNSTIFIRNHLAPFLLSIKQASEACYQQGVAQQKAIKYNIKILISGVPYVNEDNEKKFPHQGPKQAAVFYKGVEHFLAENYPHIPLLNIMALTKEGIASSLDGYHSGTDVNLLKCMLVLNVMKLMLLDSKPML